MTVVNGLWACATSEVNISGGSIEHDVWIYDSSRVSISGGSIDGDLVLTSSGLLTIHGWDFAVNGQPVGYAGLSSIYEGGPYDEPPRHLTGRLASEVNFKDFAIMGLHWPDVPDPDYFLLPL